MKMRMSDLEAMVEQRMNKLETKVEQSTDWVKEKVSQSTQAAGAALDDHILHAQAKHNELQSSIERVEKRVVESFGILTGDIIACRDKQEKSNAEQSAGMDGIDEDLHGFRRVQDINYTIPEIDDKVNAAVEGMLSNVQFINHNIANDVMNLGARVAELDERFTTMQQLERFQPEYIRIMMERLEGRIATVDMDQRNTAHGLMETGQPISNWENFLRREIREVAEDVIVSNLLKRCFAAASRAHLRDLRHLAEEVPGKQLAMEMDLDSSFLDTAFLPRLHEEGA